MSKANLQLAILYADVSGSTRIYETHGDDIARANIDKCLGILSQVVSGGGGQVIKTIGDEIMCSFPNPLTAALAARDMHQVLQDANEEGEFEIGAIHVKIGWHFGNVTRRGEEMIGEAPVTAQQVIKLAKPDEILTSEQSLDSLPGELKQNARFIDSIESRGDGGILNVYNQPWGEQEDVTRTGDMAAAYNEAARYRALVLDYPGGELRLNSENRHCSVGRGTENDICVLGNFTSRHHAEFMFRHGLFHLRDYSTNGTALVFANGRSARLHREETVLLDKGVICFGGMPDTDPEAVIRFRCETMDE